MSKGFKVPKTTYRLDFEGTELNGLEVRMTGGKLRDVFAVAHLHGVTDENATPEDIELAMSQYQDLADHIVSWNLEDDNDQPVAPNLEGLKSLEIRHIQMIAAAWQKAQVDIASPLPHASNSSSTTDLSMIRMEAIPERLAS